MQNWIYPIVLVITICCFILSILYGYENRDWDWDNNKHIYYPYHARMTLLIFFWPRNILMVMRKMS
jgi:hypothetical protein